MITRKKIGIVLAVVAALVMAIAIPGGYAQKTSVVFIDIINGGLKSVAHTVTTSKPMISLVQTWNAGGVTFTAIKAVVTDTASAAGSLLIDLQIGPSTSKFSVNKSGDVVAAGTGTFTGAISGAAVTDIVQFYDAITYCMASDANPSVLKPLRVAANDWGRTRTSAGAETYNIRCNLPAPYRTGAGKGFKLTTLKFSQQITVANLTSNTLNAVSSTCYANNVANAVAAYGGSITYTAPTVVQANPYLTTATPGTPAFMVTADCQVGIDFTVVMANTGVYTLYGLSAAWTRQD